MDFAPLVLGANVLGWTVDEADGFALLDHCLAKGVRWIDTADHYVTWIPGGQGGESERIIGRWLAERGQSASAMSIITKVGFPMGDGSRGLGRSHVRQSLERSLERLGRDHVDVYMAHVEDPDTPIEETLEAFVELMEAGKIGAIGVSQLSIATIERAFDHAARNGLPCFSVYETLYNLYDRLPFEEAGAALAARHDLKVLPFRSLAAGFLTGKYRSAADCEGKARGVRAAACLDARGLRVLAALDAVAEEVGRSPAQVALAWLAERPHVAALLAGATTEAQIDEQLEGAGLSLDARQSALLDDASRA